jgi:hypothetical protein
MTYILRPGIHAMSYVLRIKTRKQPKAETEKVEISSVTSIIVAHLTRTAICRILSHKEVHHAFNHCVDRAS